MSHGRECDAADSEVGRSGLQGDDASLRRTILDQYREIADRQTTGRLIECRDECLSAQEFWRLAQSKARRLKRAFCAFFGRDLEPGEPIALASTRTLDTLSDLIAILSAGGAFVPFNPHDPDERVGHIFNDSGAKLRVDGGSVICNESGAKVSLAGPLDDADTDLSSPAPSQLAYIIYTSGSTGKPKGVRVSHGALRHYFDWFASLDVMTGVRRVDFSINLTFDASITTSLVALACEKAISVCPEEIKNSPRAFISYLNEARIDLCKCTPSYFKLLTNEMSQFGSRVAHPVTWLLSGEEMDGKDTAAWLESHPTHVFYNSYGPTEATVTCSKFRVDSGNIATVSARIPIAQRERSAIFHILNGDMRPVAPGTPGELFLEGPVLADGYQNNPQKTAQAFVRGADGRVLYRTGDQVSRLADGTTYYHGRLDDQVKVRGVRVELGEIRHIICTHPAVLDAKVIAQAVDGFAQLAAFVVPKSRDSGEERLREMLQQHLSRLLPAEMMPQSLTILAALPYNDAGKVDAAKLRSMLEVQPVRREKKLVVSPLEMSLLNIWRRCLPGKRIGADSHFFDLGGHSLLAMDVMDRINRHFDSALPPDLLFQHPTIRALAQAIAERKGATSLHHFVHQERGARVVLIHPATGLVMPYAALEAHMPAVDFYGLSSDRFGDQKRVYASLEDQAQAYLRYLDPLLDGRPLILGGFCTGGALAYEMANQLEREGKRAEGLILIDAYKLQSYGSQASREATCRAFLSNVGIDFHSTLGQRIADEMDQNRRLVAEYRPRPRQGRTLFLQCARIDDDDVNSEHQRRLAPLLNGWTGSIDVHTLSHLTVKASHKTIMNDDASLKEVGTAIGDFIDVLSH